MLLVILSSICYLGRIGLALHGRYKINDDSTMRGEIDSDFMQLLKLCAEDSLGTLKWIDRPQNKFISPDIQNEIYSIMALHIMRDITANISGKWFILMVDEMTDLVNTEQMVVCLHYVVDNLKVYSWPLQLGVNFSRNNSIKLYFTYEPKNRRAVASATMGPATCLDQTLVLLPK